MIRVLIAEDSNIIRSILHNLLNEDSEIEIVDTVKSGQDILDYIQENKVDIIISDIFMPNKNGIEMLEDLARIKPIPVIFITVAEEEKYADLYFKALNMGVFDIIQKPFGLDEVVFESFKDRIVKTVKEAYQNRHKIIEKMREYLKKKEMEETSSSDAEEPEPPVEINRLGVKKALDSEIKKRSAERINVFSSLSDRSLPKLSKTSVIKSSIPQKTFAERDQELYNIRQKLLSGDSVISPKYLVIIGASTGGPEKISKLMTSILYSPKTAIIVIQHMPAGFTNSFANRLNELSQYNVVEVDDGFYLGGGYGYVAKGDYHLGLIRNGNGKYLFKLNQNEKKWGVRPSIDTAIESIVKVFTGKLILVILTGMGKDGSIGVELTKSHNGLTIVQDPQEAFIDSMPKNAINTGAVDYILPINDIAPKINQLILR